MKRTAGRHIPPPARGGRTLKTNRGPGAKDGPSTSRLRGAQADRLGPLAEIAPLLVWVSGPDGNVIHINHLWREYTGRDPGSLHGAGWLEAFHPDDRASVRQAAAAGLAARQGFGIECRVCGPAGEVRHVALSATPQWRAGRFLGYLGTGLDISSRMRARGAVRESESRYRELAESIGLPFCALDGERRVVYWNSACEEATGCPATAALGKRFDPLLPSATPGQLAGAVDRVLQTGKAATGEFDLRLSEGTVPFEISIFPTRGGVSLIGKEIGDRRRSEGALRSSEATYRNIFEGANDAILIFEPRTERILDANGKALQLYGFPREEFVGTSLKHLTMDIARGEQQIGRALEDGSISDFETVQFRKDGTPMTLVVNASVIEYRGEVAILAICRDLSHILAVEDVLKTQDNVLQRLLASSDDIVLMQDKEGRYLFYSGSPRFTMALDEVRGKTPYDLYPPAAARRMMERLCQVIATGKSLSAETQFDWQGETLWFLDQLSPVRNGGGEVVSVVTISRNITERKKAEEKLRRSEERYRAFIEQSADGIWRLEMLRPVPVDTPLDDQVRLIFEYGYLAECNDVMARMLGHHRPDSVVGTPLGTIVPPENEQSLEGLRSFIAAGYRLADVEQREIDPEGTVRYYANAYTGIVEQGNLVRIWGSRSDITGRKQVEREMRLLAQTITSTKDCVSITDLDERILFVNQAFLETHGYAEEELLGKPLSVVRSPAMAGDLARQILPATLHGGWYGEVLHRKKDGRDIPLELWISVVRNDEGDPVALVGVARDVTDRKRMEQALRKSESHLRRITDAMRDVVVQTGADGVVRYISPSGQVMLGHRADEMLGRRILDRVHPDDLAAAEEEFRSAITGERGIQMEFRYQHATGRYLWLEAVGNLLLDDQGRVTGAVFALRDAGERKNAEERLRGTVREKEVMLKEIHHRVKNNLQVISSLLSLQAEEIADEDIQRHLRESQNRIRSMAIIHQRLYRSSNLAEVSIGAYADELCAQLGRSYGASGREIQIQVQAEEIVLSVDVAIPCGIILNELVSNALKYAFPPERGGTVTVTIRRDEGKVRMEIRDDGVGLPAGMNPREAESLGLRLVEMLAEQIGATVEVGPVREGGPPGTAWRVAFEEHGLEPPGGKRGHQT